MNRKAQWAFFLSVWGLAAVIGHLASGSRVWGIPPNGLLCLDSSPLPHR